MFLSPAVLVLTLALGLSAYLLCTLIYNVYFHPLSKFPGNTWWCASRLPFVYSMVTGQLPHDYRTFHYAYGPVVRVAPDELSFIDPAAWKDIYTKPGWVRPWVFRGKPPGIVADNLITASETDHARFRKSLGPAFSEQVIKRQESIVNQYTDMLIDGLKKKISTSASASTTVDAVKWLSWTAFDAIGDLGFGSSFDCLSSQKTSGWVQVAMHFKNVMIAASFKYFPPLDSFIEAITPKAALKDVDMMFQTAKDKIAERMLMKTERPDIIGHIQNQGWSMTVAELETNAAVIIGAGSESLTTSLVGTINNLLVERATLDRLTTEIRTTFASEADITGVSVANLPYLNAVLNEGMRMCPTIPDGSRRVIPANEVGTIAGYTVPGPATVSVPQWSAYRSGFNFVHPTTFVPERWLGESEIYKRDRKEIFQPFSVGAHNCLGQPLAWHEMRLILARLVYNFDLSLPEDEIPLRWSSQDIFFTWVKEPVLVKITARKD